MIRKGGIEQLQKKINLTKAECKAMEIELGKRMDYLQDNAGSIAVNGVVKNMVKVPTGLMLGKDILANAFKSGSIKEFGKKMLIDVIKLVAVRFGLNFMKDFAEKHTDDIEDKGATEPIVEKVPKTE